MGKKAHLGTNGIEEICPFPHRRRGMFYFKNDTFYLEKRGTFWVWKFWECKRPRPPDSTALDCAPSGAMRKVHGDNFPVPPSLYKGPKCDRINAQLRYKGAP